MFLCVLFHPLSLPVEYAQFFRSGVLILAASSVNTKTGKEWRMLKALGTDKSLKPQGQSL